MPHANLAHIIVITVLKMSVFGANLAHILATIKRPVYNVLSVIAKGAQVLDAHNATSNSYLSNCNCILNALIARLFTVPAALVRTRALAVLKGTILQAKCANLA